MDQAERIRCLEKALQEADERAQAAKEMIEKADKRAQAAEEMIEKTPLNQFLQLCHELHSAFDVVQGKGAATTGIVTKPQDRLYPAKILPWTDFAERQAAVWQQIRSDSAFCNDHAFPSRSDFDFCRSELKSVSSEISFRDYVRHNVESMTEKVFVRINESSTLQQTLGIRGTFCFQDHTNLRDEDNTELVRLSRAFKAHRIRSVQ